LYWRLWLRRRWLAAALLAVLAAVKLLLPGPLIIHFLDVGQGDGIVIETPSHHFWLVDGGSTTVSGLGEYRLAPFLKTRGASVIDFAVVSHPDRDHISGLTELLTMWPPKYLILSPAAAAADSGQALVALAADKGVKVLYMRQGEQMRDGQVVISCLGPDEGADLWDVNQASLVLEVAYKDFSLLLPGDIDSRVEAALAAQWRSVSLLKVAHHGAGGGTGADFLAAAQPLAAVISCGENNIYGHPHPDTVKRLEAAGCRIYLTPRDGAVQVITNGKGMRIRPFLT
jgi:competence protein ComEC